MSHHHDHSNETETEGRLRIIRLIKGVLETKPNPSLTAFIQREHAKTANPDIKALLNLLLTDNEANRAKARDGLAILERQVQEASVAGNAPKIAELAPVAAPATPPAKDNVIDLTKRVHTAPSGSIRPFYIPSEDPEAEVIQWPTGPEADSPRIPYSIITAETTPEQLAHSMPTSIFGLCIGIKGQPKMAHGFGFYLPLPRGKAKFNGNDPIQFKIALTMPEVITLFDDHVGPRLGGVANFFAAYESLKDGYRFLLDLEIIPVNGRFVMSMKPQLHFDRNGNNQQLACNIVHLHKLLTAAENLAFLGFTGETEIT